MKAARLHAGATALSIDEVATPEPGPGEVRVTIRRAFVAPFQVSLIAGGGGFVTPKRPFSPGLDGVGRVDAVGEGVAGLVAGERVYCDNFHRSGRVGAPDDACFLGNFAVGAESAAMLSRWPAGSFARMALYPAECVIPIDRDLACDDGVLTRLGWLGTAYGAFRKVGVHAGQDIAVLGATGAVGSSAVMVALAMGARRVHALGRREAVLDELAGLDSRVAAAKALPADARVHVAFTSIEGDDAAPVEAMLPHIRPRGALVVAASVESPMAVPLGLLLGNDIAIRGSLWFERGDIADLLAMIGSGVLDLSPVRLREYPLRDVARALEAVAARPSGLEQVVLRCDD